jgi:hypothetical protein
VKNNRVHLAGGRPSLSQGPSFVAGNWTGTRTFLVAYDKVPLRDGVINPEKVAKLDCAN